jgi:ureidoacrylate peracid hydrolase
MGFRPDLSDLGPPGSPNREVHLRLSVGADGILVRDCWGTEIVEELAPEPGDLQIWKNRFSGFAGTELDTILRSLGAQCLIVTGCTTSVCVESTIRDAMFRDYSCLLLADCTAEPLGAGFSRSNHEASLFLIQAMFGRVSSSAQLLEALGQEPLARAALAR